MTGVLARKLRRDILRQRSQFAAVVVVIALGVAVFIAATDAYRNLNASFTRAYSVQRLPDVVLSGPRAPALLDAARALPARPVVAHRLQADLGARVGEHTFLGRVISVPAGAQPAVAKLALRSGRLPRDGEVLIEQHLADHFRLGAGDTIELLGSAGWRSFRISGTALSAEYFWPARSKQEVLLTADQFGVMFTTERSVAALVTQPEHQLALYGRDRARAASLVRAATAMARANALVPAARTDQPSWSALDQDVKAFGQFAKLLPSLFLVAAILGAFILLSRLVHAQRAVIGTLAANGISPASLRRHYLGFGLIAGAAAALPGAVAGYFLGSWITVRYTGALGLPLHVTSLHAATLVIGCGGGIVAASAAAWGPARSAARVSPAEAMRITPSARGRSSWLETLVPPLRRLPARWRMVLRSMSRNRRRALFTIAGIAVSLSLVLVFTGLRDTVTGILDRQFTTIDRSNGYLYAAPGYVDAVDRAARADPAVSRAEPFSRTEVTISAGGRRKGAERRYDTLLLGLMRDTTMHGFVARSGRAVRLDDRGGLLVAAGLGRLLRVRPGDTVTLTSPDGTRLEEPVRGFVDEPLTAVAYVSLSHLERVAGRPMASGVAVKLRPGSDTAAAARRLGALPGAIGYLDNRAVQAKMREAFAVMDVLVVVMLTFAVVMAAALVFNAMSANVAERSVELGTLHAAGLSRRILARLVAVENIALTLIAVPIGLAAGTLLAERLISAYETEGYKWTLRMQGSSMLLVAAGIVIASVASQLPALRRLRRIDVARIVRERSL